MTLILIERRLDKVKREAKRRNGKKKSTHKANSRGTTFVLEYQSKFKVKILNAHLGFFSFFLYTECEYTQKRLCKYML